MRAYRLCVVAGALLAVGALSTVVSAAPQKRKGGAKAAAAAPEPSVGPITGPIADYWVSASTASGFGAQLMGGGKPSMGSLMGMAMGRGGGPQKSLTLDLGSTQSPSGPPQAAHAPPPGLGVGASLPLLTPRPAKAGPPTRETDPGDPDTYQRPKGRLLFYWGCGDHVGPGQPVVLDFSTIGTGAPLPDFGGGITVHTERPPSYGRVTTYGRWPNEQTRVKVPPTGSLVGSHSVQGDYAPPIAFEVTPELDFMPPFDVQNTGPSAGGGKRLAWNPVQGAGGYYLQLVGANGAGGGRDRNAGSDMVFWSSSAVKPGVFGGGLADYLPPAEVSRLVSQRAVLPPSASECVVPSEVAQAAPMGIVLSIAYGPERIFTDPPRPRSGPWDIRWRTRVRVKSTNTMLLGMPGGPGGREAAQTEAADRRRHRQEDPRRVQALLMRRALVLVALLPLAACAHGGSAPESPSPTAEPPNARARLYADCMGASAQAGTYDRFGRYLRLTCTGAPAEALFTELEVFARSRGHVSIADGVETRGLTSTTVNDRCWKRAAQTSCLIVVPVGAFLDPANDVPPSDAQRK